MVGGHACVKYDGKTGRDLTTVLRYSWSTVIARCTVFMHGRTQDLTHCTVVTRGHTRDVVHCTIQCHHAWPHTRCCTLHDVVSSRVATHEMLHIRSGRASDGKNSTIVPGRRHCVMTTDAATLSRHNESATHVSGKVRGRHTRLFIVFHHTMPLLSAPTIPGCCSHCHTLCCPLVTMPIVTDHCLSPFHTFQVSSQSLFSSSLMPLFLEFPFL